MDGRNPSGAVTSGIARKPPPTAEPPTSATASKRVICRPPLFSGSAAAGGGVVAAHAGTGARAASRNREGCVEPTLISPRTARCGVLRLVGLGRVSRAAVSGADSRAEHDGSRRHGSRRSCRPCIVVGEEAQHALKMLHPTILELGDVCQEGAAAQRLAKLTPHGQHVRDGHKGWLPQGDVCQEDAASPLLPQRSRALLVPFTMTAYEPLILPAEDTHG